MGKSFALIGASRDRVGGKNRILDCGLCLIYQANQSQSPGIDSNVPPLCRDAAVPCVSSNCFCCQGHPKGSARIFLPADPSSDESTQTLRC